MLLSEKWLREWVNPALSTQELADQITMAGLEVDGIEPVAGEFSGVVVGEIVAIEKHPDADKLRVCQVTGGDEVAQVVCGAPNARLGLKIPFALVGAVLPGNFKIKKAKLRGVESFGMLCAEAELGMSDSSDGLMELAADAPVGTDFREYLSLNDQIIEVDLTPNRADCLSVRGVARDISALNDCALTAPEITAVAATVRDTFPVAIEAPQDCPRYAGRVIKNVDLSKPAPLWMVEKLRRAGVRSIDAAVDVTNYVMLELGQPLHAFDLAELSGGIKVRKAVAGEKLTLLDGSELDLRDDSLVIADHEKPMALAGIMGGESSGVSVDTKDIFLESAFFAPAEIAGRARSYGLHTDSSHRFERGVDYQLPLLAIERATQLMLDIIGGEAGELTVVDTEFLPKPSSVALRAARIEKMLGLAIPAERVEQILNGLGLSCEPTSEGWTVAVPSWRFDISIEVDLLEELARIYGYNKLPVKPIRDELIICRTKEAKVGLPAVRSQLVSRGYQEAITYSFVDPKMQQQVQPGREAISLLNPISAEMGDMRNSLWTGLLQALSHNVKRQQSRVRLFETGLSFVPTKDGLVQEQQLAAVLYGRRAPESWSENNEVADFFDLKGDLEAVLALGLDKNYRFEVGEHPALHPGQTANIYCNDVHVGIIGAIHPSLQKKLDLPQPAYVFEINLAAVTTRSLPKFQPLSKFPEVRRDLAVIVERHITAAQVLQVAKEAAGDYLVNLKFFDSYQGKGIDTQRKSLGLGLTFQHSSRTLTEDEVNESIGRVVDSLQQQLDASLRN